MSFVAGIAIGLIVGFVAAIAGAIAREQRAAELGFISIRGFIYELVPAFDYEDDDPDGGDEADDDAPELTVIRGGKDAAA